jgi:hypothetical protein
MCVSFFFQLPRYAVKGNFTPRLLILSTSELAFRISGVSSTWILVL